MKIRHQLLALGLASSALFAAGTASAALTYHDGDIFLAFRTTTGTPDTLLINLGSYTQFLTPGTTLTFGGPATFGLDLATYTSGPTDWFDRTDLSWSLFGAIGDNGVSLLATKARTNLGVQSAYPFGSASSTTRNNTLTAIQTVENGFIGTGYTTTASSNTPNAGFQQTGLNLNSYYAKVSGAPDFGFFNPSIEGSNASGIDSTVLDLFVVSGNGDPALVHGSSLGKFTINDSGTVTFTAVVPEPSISALLVVGLAGLGFLRRRPQPALA